MKTILLPTDFSLHSEKALEFAIEIAKISNAEIIVTHAFVIPVIDANVPSSIMEDLCEEEMQVVESSLQRICDRISKIKSENGKYIKSNYVAEFNLPQPEISKLSEEKKADLIIMGTEADDHFHISLGSTTSSTLDRVKCPILIVKEQMTFKPFNDIYLAIENFKDDISSLKQLLPLANAFQSTIRLIHINKFAERMGELVDANIEKAEDEEILNDLKRKLNFPNLELKFCYANEPYESIVRIANDENPDLIALIKHQKNWIDSLFHKSVINSIIKKSELPLLVLHKNI